MIGIRLAPLDIQVDGNRKIVLEADVELVPEPRMTRSPSEPELYNLGIRMVVWPDGNSVLDVRYGRTFGVNLTEAKTMYRKLAVVDRALSKMNCDLGWPADPADSFMRAVRAIGAEQVIETLDAERAEFSGEKYEFMELGPATDWLRRMLQEAIAKLAAPTAAETVAPAPTPT